MGNAMDYRACSTFAGNLYEGRKIQGADLFSYARKFSDRFKSNDKACLALLSFMKPADLQDFKANRNTITTNGEIWNMIDTWCRHNYTHKDFVKIATGELIPKNEWERMMYEVEWLKYDLYMQDILAGKATDKTRPEIEEEEVPDDTPEQAMQKLKEAGLWVEPPKEEPVEKIVTPTQSTEPKGVKEAIFDDINAIVSDTEVTAPKANKWGDAVPVTKPTEVKHSEGKKLEAPDITGKKSTGKKNKLSGLSAIKNRLSTTLDLMPSEPTIHICKPNEVLVIEKVEIPNAVESGLTGPQFYMDCVPKDISRLYRKTGLIFGITATSSATGKTYNTVTELIVPINSVGVNGQALYVQKGTELSNDYEPNIKGGMREKVAGQDYQLIHRYADVGADGKARLRYPLLIKNTANFSISLWNCGGNARKTLKLIDIDEKYCKLKTPKKNLMGAALADIGTSLDSFIELL